MSLVCRELGVSLDEQLILSEISFEIEPGSVVGIVGPNGSGKSTLLRALYGFIPSSGSVEWDGRKLSDWGAAELADHVGACPQEAEASLDFRVEQLLSLRFNGDISALSTCYQELPFLKLRSLANKRLSQLSGGERQRVRLGLALIGKAPWLILDEPANHLDLATGFSLFEHLGVSRERGGVLMALHDLQSAASHCQSLLVMKDGKLLAQGHPEELITPELLSDVFGLQGRLVTDGEHRYLHLEGVSTSSER